MIPVDKSVSNPFIVVTGATIVVAAAIIISGITIVVAAAVSVATITVIIIAVIFVSIKAHVDDTDLTQLARLLQQALGRLAVAGHSIVKVAAKAGINRAQSVGYRGATFIDAGEQLPESNDCFVNGTADTDAGELGFDTVGILDGITYAAGDGPKAAAPISLTALSGVEESPS